MDRLVSIQNPWWTDPSRINSDPHVRAYDESPLKWFPIGSEDFGKPGIWTLRGIRQIGKTTHLKLLIRKLLLGGEDPKKILFLSLDLVANHRELVELLTPILEALKPRYILLDEVSFVEDWQRGIKWLADSGLLAGARVILTGSSAVDITAGAERMPGRRGAGRDIVLFPLSPGQMARSMGKQIPEMHPEEILKLDEEDLRMLALTLEGYRWMWDIFSNYGGMPFVVATVIKEKEIPPEKLQALWDIIISDAERLSRSRIIAQKMLITLARLAGQRFLPGKVAGEIGITKPTFNSYLELMARSYIAGILAFVEKDKGILNLQKQRKVYLADISLYNAVRQNTGVQCQKPQLVESAIFELLARFAMGPEGLLPTPKLGMWYSKKGREVDFILGGIPIEVKYQKAISPSDYTTLKRVFGQGIVISRDTIGRDGGIVIIPAWLFSMLV